MLRRLHLTIPEGSAMRDFVVNGVLRELLAGDPDLSVVLLTPAWRSRPFLERVAHPRVAVRRHDALASPAWLARTLHGRRKNGLGGGWLHGWLEAAETWAHRPPRHYFDTLDELPPDLVVSAHPMPLWDYDVAVAARRRGLPLAGVVRSWDNIRKRLAAMPEYISVWGPTNYREAIEVLGYRQDCVVQTGSPSFDPYFDPAVRRERGEFIRGLGLDPTAPVITLALAALPYNHNPDETHLVDELLGLIAARPALRGAQLVIRLHPVSRLIPFLPYRGRERVVVSHDSYLPGLGWWQDEDDIAEAVNLLAHSDVIVTPGSSWTLEAAIFDTPVVCPFYHPMQAEAYARAIDAWCLNQHFKPLLEESLVPVARDLGALAQAVEDALAHPEAGAAQRRQLFERYIHYGDGRSARRVAEWLIRLAGGAPAS